jgi:hypothetical protein
VKEGTQVRLKGGHVVGIVSDDTNPEDDIYVLWPGGIWGVYGEEDLEVYDG